MQSRTKPVLAKAIETTPETLIVTTEPGLSRFHGKTVPSASPVHLSRNGAGRNSSPSGYGIHWPLIDEDLAVGPLLFA